jgi:hypothetical protein
MSTVGGTVATNEGPIILHRNRYGYSSTQSFLLSFPPIKLGERSHEEAGKALPKCPKTQPASQAK